MDEPKEPTEIPEAKAEEIEKWEKMFKEPEPTKRTKFKKRIY